MLVVISNTTGNNVYRQGGLTPASSLASQASHMVSQPTAANELPGQVHLPTSGLKTHLGICHAALSAHFWVLWSPLWKKALERPLDDLSPFSSPAAPAQTHNLPEMTKAAPQEGTSLTPFGSEKLVCLLSELSIHLETPPWLAPA